MDVDRPKLGHLLFLVPAWIVMRLPLAAFQAFISLLVLRVPLFVVRHAISPSGTSGATGSLRILVSGPAIRSGLMSRFLDMRPPSSWQAGFPAA